MGKNDIRPQGVFLFPGGFHGHEPRVGRHPERGGVTGRVESAVFLLRQVDTHIATRLGRIVFPTGTQAQDA